MKCPYCNEEMLLGYIQCRDGLYWNDKKRLIAAFPPLAENAINLRTTATAYNCPKCKKIVIDYAE